LGRGAGGRVDRGRQVGQTFAVLGRDRDRGAQAERPGLAREARRRQSLALVGDQDHGLALATQPACEVPIERGQAGLGVDHHQREIGFGQRRFGLLPQPSLDAVLGAFGQTGGVDRPERDRTDPASALDAVAGDAGRRIDQRLAPPDQTVEQGRFADVRPTDDRDRERHRRSPVHRPGHR
jgi:hypothetical protein